MMTKIKKPKSLILAHGNGVLVLDNAPRSDQSRSTNQPRRCRAFTSRTMSYVRQSLDSWSYIYEREVVPFEPGPRTCAELAKAVKNLLSACPSEDEREVLAYQSIKKGLPDSCKCMEAALLDGLVANIIGGQPPTLPAGYLPFVRKLVAQLFPKGWDTGYEGFCRRLAPPLKGVLEGGRSMGGALGLLRNRDLLDHSDYLEVALFGRSFSRPLDRYLGALQVAQSAGKPRPLTTFSGDGLFLKPLHKTIYDRLSKQSWLSRGDVTAETLLRAGFRSGNGGVLVSGDYASATDNLSIEVMEEILSALLENCAIVPPNIREFAKKACRPFLYSSREEWAEDLILESGSTVGVPRKGQMMGSYLSFPLLCLQNYLAFRWSTRTVKGRIPVVINGDDILFQAEREVADRWMETVGSLGLEVEKTKTSVSASFGSLNSTLFEWSDGVLRVVPTLRFGMLSPSEFPNSLGRSFESFLQGIKGPERWRAANVYFEFHIGALRKTSWSLPSLGFRGALAHRLARKFGVLQQDRLVGELPQAPVPHSVCLPQDLISEVPNEYVDSWVKDLSSSETASWKWSVGFCTADRVKAGIQWALASTRWTDDSDVVSDLVAAMSVTDREFSFRWDGGGRLSLGVSLSRRELKDPFLKEFEPRTTTRIFFRVVAECLLRTDRFGERLPTYEEATEG